MESIAHVLIAPLRLLLRSDVAQGAREAVREDLAAAEEDDRLLNSLIIVEHCSGEPGDWPEDEWSLL
jgi:hypothetical protein